jgi:AraC-like DNA-binding protein
MNEKGPPGVEPIGLDETRHRRPTHGFALGVLQGIAYQLDTASQARANIAPMTSGTVALPGLASARERIEREYARDLTVAELARTARCSAFHFIRSFKSAFGLTPGRFLRRRRLERARELLTSTPLPVTEVCDAVGYGSLGTFSREFRRETGESPTAYRRRTRKPVYVPGCFVRMYRADR